MEKESEIETHIVIKNCNKIDWTQLIETGLDWNLIKTGLLCYWHVLLDAHSLTPIDITPLTFMKVVGLPVAFYQFAATTSQFITNSKKKNNNKKIISTYCSHHNVFMIIYLFIYSKIKWILHIQNWNLRRYVECDDLDSNNGLSLMTLHTCDVERK